MPENAPPARDRLADVGDAILEDLAVYIDSAGDWESAAIVDVRHLAAAYRDVRGALVLEQGTDDRSAILEGELVDTNRRLKDLAGGVDDVLRAVDEGGVTGDYFGGRLEPLGRAINNLEAARKRAES